jgi:hypothetical protein
MGFSQRAAARTSCGPRPDEACRQSKVRSGKQKARPPQGAGRNTAHWNFGIYA